jgi:hypothetical protein
VFKPSHSRFCSLMFLATTFFASFVRAQEPNSNSIPYLQLSQPQRVLAEAQSWEGNEFPHTMSVIKMNHGGFRYWGWYGLNEGRGIGLARSDDLVHWTKYEKNPLWNNSRWPSVLQQADPKNPEVLYSAIKRNYDTQSSYIVLATSRDSIGLKEEKILVAAVANQRNQNLNLFEDPRSRQFYLTYCRGKDKDQLEIVRRHAASVAELDKAPGKVLLRSSTTIVAPTLLFLKNKMYPSGVYFLAAKIYPHRYTSDPEGEWQVKIFTADVQNGNFQPVIGDPIQKGQRGCLFQHIFNNRSYGYDYHLEANDKWVLEETEASLE